MDKNALIGKIKEIRKTFKENEWCYRVSEENVRAEIIDPILRILGWRLPYIKREEHGMDYVLCSEKDIHVNSKIIVVEAKKYKEQLWYEQTDDKPSNAEQLQGYLTDSSYIGKIPVENKLGVLTNGIRWYLCDSNGIIKREIILLELNDKGEVVNDSIDYVKMCDFFEQISFDGIYNSVNSLIKNEQGTEIPCYERKKMPEIICINDINGKGEPSEYKKRCGSLSHCFALYYVAKDADKKIDTQKKSGCVITGSSLIDYLFHKDIVTLESTGRTELECEERGYYYVGDYNIYDKIALLQEINTSLDLGLTIYLK